MAQRAFSITEHAGPEGLAELRDAWRALAGAMPAPRLHHLWEAHAAYARHLAVSPEAMTYLALRDSGRLQAICALEARGDRALGVPVRVWGLPWAAEWPLGDVIAAEDDARAALLPAVIAHLRASRPRRAMLVLGPLPAGSKLWDGLASAQASAAVYPQSGWNVVDCTRPADEVFSALSKNFRGNLRKARNKLAKLDRVEFVSAKEPEDLTREFDAFLAVEASGWKGEAGTGSALALDAEKVAFYRQLVGDLGAQRRCRIDALYAEGRCIASELSFQAGSDLEMCKVGFDESYARVAPGQLLFEHTLRSCCDDPAVRHIDLMSNTPWHNDWRPELEPMRMARVATSGLGSALMPAVRFRFTSARRLARRVQGRAG